MREETTEEEVYIANNAKDGTVQVEAELPLVNGAAAATNKLQIDDNKEKHSDKWAIAAPNVDLSGEWSLLVTDEFKKQYDNYLQLLDQPAFVRSVALSIVGMTIEETRQSHQGRNLFIRGRNARGVWERTLQTTMDESTNENNTNNAYKPTHYPIVTADNEQVIAETWWEAQGTKHRSWLRGVSKYGGGSFESLRYLEEPTRRAKDATSPTSRQQQEDVLVCESTFHPNDPAREKAKVTWRFQRRTSSTA